MGRIAGSFAGSFRHPLINLYSLEIAMERSLIHDLLTTWRISSIIFGNLVAVVMLLAWWQGETWVRANGGAMAELSSRPGWQVKK